jgi:hypothetical protein|tara:strand:+ start:55 stop:435 length:381 start_codon:yes stop_codon:yes gene_type:complete
MDPVTAGLGLVDTFVNKFVKDKDLAAKLKAQAKSEEFAGELSLLVGQLEINKAEASHASVFVSGWRPFCGWVCGMALLYSFILSPFLDIWLDVPKLEMGDLMTVLLGMLGLGGLRTHEKTKSVANK